MVKDAFVENGEMAPCANNPPAELAEYSEMNSNRVELIALLLEQCDVRLDVRTEWSAIQAVEGLGFNG